MPETRCRRHADGFICLRVRVRLPVGFKCHTAGSKAGLPFQSRSSKALPEPTGQWLAYYKRAAIPDAHARPLGLPFELLRLLPWAGQHRPKERKALQSPGFLPLVRWHRVSEHTAAEVLRSLCGDNRFGDTPYRVCGRNAVLLPKQAAGRRFQ